MKIPMAGSGNGNPVIEFILPYAVIVAFTIYGRETESSALFYLGAALVFLAPTFFYFLRSGVMIVRESFLVSSEKLNIVDHVYPFDRKGKGYRVLSLEGKKRIYSAVPLNPKKNELMMYNYCEAILKDPCFQNFGCALVLGAGGGAVPRFIAMEYPEATVDAIDISSAAVDAAREYFIPKSVKNINLYAMDAFEYIRGYSKSTRYGFIFVDLFDGEKPVPFDRGSADKLKRMLSPDGIAVFNLFTCYDFAKEYAAVLQTAFDRIYVFMYCSAYILLAPGDRCEPDGFLKKIKADTSDSDLKFAFEIIKKRKT